MRSFDTADKLGGTLRRAVRSWTFAGILGARHMECAYYFAFCRLYPFAVSSHRVVGWRKISSLAHASGWCLVLGALCFVLCALCFVLSAWCFVIGDW
jgi:hypothetical protein